MSAVIWSLSPECPVTKVCVSVWTPALLEGVPPKNPDSATYLYEDNHSISVATDFFSPYLAFLICEMGIMGVTASLGCCEVNTGKHLRRYFAQSRHSTHFSCYYSSYYHLRILGQDPQKQILRGYPRLSDLLRQCSWGTGEETGEGPGEAGTGWERKRPVRVQRMALA